MHQTDVYECELKVESTSFLTIWNCKIIFLRLTASNLIINGYYQLLVKSMHKKVLKSTQWMPRCILPKKDVEDCEKSRVAVNKL